MSAAQRATYVAIRQAWEDLMFVDQMTGVRTSHDDLVAIASGIDSRWTLTPDRAFELGMTIYDLQEQGFHTLDAILPQILDDLDHFRVDR